MIPVPQHPKARLPVSVAGGEVRVEGGDPEMPRTRQALREFLQDV